MHTDKLCLRIIPIVEVRHTLPAKLMRQKTFLRKQKDVVDYNTRVGLLVSHKLGKVTFQLTRDRSFLVYCIIISSCPYPHNRLQQPNTPPLLMEFFFQTTVKPCRPFFPAKPADDITHLTKQYFLFPPFPQETMSTDLQPSKLGTKEQYVPLVTKPRFNLTQPQLG
jgi:hypothetical protein